VKPRRSNQSSHALTLTEVLVVIAILVLLAAILLPVLAKVKRGGSHIPCASNVKQICLSYLIWADDHNGKFPMEISTANGGTMELVAKGDVFSTFQVMSNELENPRLLYCPCDTDHSVFPIAPGPLIINIDSAGSNFSGDLKNHVSYFVGLDADTNRPKAFLSGDDNFAVGGVPVKSGLLEISTNAPITWTAARHVNQGNIGLADGSVWQTDDKLLVQKLIETGVATNRLAIP
jgi:prepilin-type N-terminal cleavage/methylation domain-containing protein/prepilin-type processing-associated H-X9-DG protein